MEGVERYKVDLLPHNPFCKEEFIEAKDKFDFMYKSGATIIPSPTVILPTMTPSLEAREREEFTALKKR